MDHTASIYFTNTRPATRGMWLLDRGTFAELSKTTRRRSDRAPSIEKRVYCIRCHHSISALADRIHVNGQCGGKFSNPYGIEFRLECFRAAPGCLVIGRVTDEHTWFKGYAWTIALCASCREHLGWRYSAFERAAFFGLIVDRLQYDG